MNSNDSIYVHGSGKTVHLAFLTGGPLESLLVQLAKSRDSPAKVPPQLSAATEKVDSSAEETSPSSTVEFIAGNH